MKQKKYFILILSGLFFCFANCIHGNNPDKGNGKAKTITFRGIYADDPAGQEGLYNPERGLRLEIAVDIFKFTVCHLQLLCTDSHSHSLSLFSPW